MNPYEVLDIEMGVSDEDLRAAYRRASSRTHPDKGGTVEEFQQVRKAYEYLSKRPCSKCSGTGVVITRSGMFVTKDPCPNCWKTK